MNDAGKITTHIGLATTLVALGHTLTGVHWEHNRCYFTIAPGDDFERRRSDFFACQMLVEPQALLAAFSLIKREMKKTRSDEARIGKKGQGQTT